MESAICFLITGKNVSTEYDLLLSMQCDISSKKGTLLPPYTFQAAEPMAFSLLIPSSVSNDG